MKNELIKFLLHSTKEQLKIFENDLRTQEIAKKIKL